MHITFQDPKTGERKSVKVGWSWTCFLFSCCFGLPLYRRNLKRWGQVMWANIALMAAIRRFHVDPDIAAVMLLVLVLALIGFSVFLGLTANRMTAMRLLELGWRPIEPEGQTYRWAKEKWALA